MDKENGPPRTFKWVDTSSSETGLESNKKVAEMHRRVCTTDMERHNEAGPVIDQTINREKADSRQMQGSHEVP